MKLNSWSISIIIFWICGSLVSFFGQTDGLEIALVASCFLGCFYLLIND
jgi:hypothetical protein